MQNILNARLPSDLEKILEEHKSSKFLLVCDSAFEYLSISRSFDLLSVPHVIFNDFIPNPVYEDVLKGIDVFKKTHCDFIVAVGGGSSMDVAKCIKLFSTMDNDTHYLKQIPKSNDITLVAIPTTAGTGSESTRFAVIYYEGEKQSVAHESIIPSYALLIPDVLKTLPVYQKKCTVLDAFSQAVESWWSVNSTNESRSYSKSALELLNGKIAEYVTGDSEKINEMIMTASNYSGRAINISQTTAIHAMSYKITSLFNLPHGHAVALCLPHVWKHSINNMNMCTDPRGEKYFNGIMNDISHTLGSPSPLEAVETFQSLLKELKITPPEINSEQMDMLVNSVNETRLKNHPVKLEKAQIRKLYEKIFNITEVL